MSSPFFTAPCGSGARWDPVRQLSDQELRRIASALRELLLEVGDATGRVANYLQILALHPESELQRREHELFLTQVDLQGGHHLEVGRSGPAGRSGAAGDIWAAECFCGWEGPGRGLRLLAEQDAEAHRSRADQGRVA